MTAERRHGLALHCHHDSLIDYVWDYNGRVQAIRGKPKAEQELRLRLFRMIPDEGLPETKALAAYKRAEAAYESAKATYKRAVATYRSARAALDSAMNAYMSAENALKSAEAAFWSAWAAYRSAEAAYTRSIDVEKLHETLCEPDCPWDGQTIFPAKKAEENL